MVVQQSQLPATDTTKNMEDYYNDAVVTDIDDVNRSIHNRTQFVRLVLTRPQPTSAFRADSGTPSNITETPHYIDGVFTANATSGANLMIVGFAPRLVSTTSIRIFSTAAIDTTLGDWTVSTSLSNIDSEYSDSNFEAAVSSVAQAIVSTPAGNQFRYTLTVGTPAVDTTGNGLPYWRIVHADSGAFDDVTEVQILEPLTPTISYFETDGDFASSFTFEQSNILDACWDPNNNSPDGQFFTIRFNDALTGTATVTLDDDFSDGDAGTASGTNDFNPARWTESSTNTQFLRVSDALSYNVATGKGQLETTYTFQSDFDVQIDVTPTTVTTESMWFVLRALDGDNKALMSEGVGIETSPTSSGVFFSTYVDSFTNSTADSTLRDLRGLWHNVASGTDSFAIIYEGANTWSVSGTQTGELTDATTGVFYGESVDAGTPIEFVISATATPTIGEQFTFDLISDNVKKEPNAGGTLGIARTGSSWTTDNVVVSPASLGTDEVSIELFGNTNGVINISADDYTVTTGSGTFSDVSVFTIERTDTEGDLLASNPTVIESFDVIGDPSLTYNDFLDGRVQIACSSLGTLAAGFIYVKINNVLYKYPNDISLGSEDGTSATTTSTAQLETDGTKSLQWTRESTSSNPEPFLTYLEYDETLDILHLRTINHTTLLDTTDDKEVLLEISDYSTNAYGVFYDQNDFDTLYYVDSSTNLQAFNIDDRISAFMAVNAGDVTLPAGTAEETNVNADVINAWGESLDGKTVTFAVTAGDGAVTPSSDVTTSGGRATTQFTVGATVGVSTVTATVTET